ncbi:MAG: type II toxin-antitoxin system Phd/YefM family antitoxin [Planctomycetes bacterium]|nr:type II toxin-antitoxin system Phd/YefM family antitoxin [Planctomycetota bacterium]
MASVTVDELSGKLRTILDEVERSGEEVVIMRNDHAVARLVPATRGMTAREFFGDMPGTLTYEEGEALLRDIKEMDRFLDQRISDPWE